MALHADSPPDVTALFVLRLRFEPGSSRQMRAEVRMTCDVTTGFGAASTVTDVEAAVALLREWLLTQAQALPPDA